MTRPAVSILIPVYNRKAFIGPCVESALSQTFPDFEVVIVDNASTDGTWELLQTYARRDARIRLFRNEINIGALRNWARCFEEARGEYGKILFSDDLMYPDFLARTVALMADDIAFVVTAAEVGPAPGQGSIEFRWKPESGIYPSGDYFQASLGRGAVPFSPGAGLIRVADLRRNLRTDIASPSIKDFAKHGAGPDLLLYLLPAHQYPKVGFIAEPLALFREHSGTLSLSIADRLFDCYAQTRVWFGLEFGLPEYSASALTTIWLRKMREQRSWVSPRKIRQQFLCNPEAIGTASLLRHIPEVLLSRAGSSPSQAVRNPRATPAAASSEQSKTNQSPHSV